MTSTTTCPYCHQTKIGKTPIAASSLQSPEDEVAYILTETRRIEDQIQQLHESKASLLRRMNAVQSSTRALPPETLSYIFQHTSPAPDFFRGARGSIQSDEVKFAFHLVLGSVSSHWRQVVHSTPILWSSIRISDIPSPRRAEKWSAFLQACFQKSGGLPLDMAFDRFGRILQPSDCFFSPKTDNILLENCHRIRSLRFDYYVCEKWLTLIPKLTGLVDLSIGSVKDIHTLSFPSSPHLTRLRLEGFIPDLDTGNLSNRLTVLELTDLPIDICMKALVECPALTEFRCSEPSEPEGDYEVSVISGAITLPSLEYLQWTFTFEDIYMSWNLDLLVYIHTPALNTLRWVQSTEDSQSLPSHIPEFFNRLPLTLNVLEFVEVAYESWPQRQIVNHLRRDTQIRSIILERCSVQFLEDILTRLGDEDEGSLVFPHLSYMRVEGCLLPDSYHYSVLRPRTGSLLARALQRRCHSIEEFTFDIVHVPELHWEDSDINTFNRLVDEGLNLKILHHGHVFVGRNPG
ncbi:hypothetical protein D9756_002056 [Leucocoprinus leucothites]|uniref:F-box domain-containing protein n=1 Tax=Leucocoprinus leucothites TaxID=201217 RepID=A0A8H5LLU1_9AGAR|nr:hypothetical protein D9756_002056 [Leucoagaricus leucothites]